MNIHQCPYLDCNIAIEIVEVNCAIFRCGVYKNGQQIDPHLPQEECEKLKNQDKIWGCGRPFKLVNSLLVICEYI
jgi:hypothetical protein